MNKKRLGLFLFAGLLIASALVFLPAVKNIVQADVTAGSELRGWMWSSDIGWISVNSKDRPAPVSTYAVEVNAEQALEGYAWSPNLGWLRFNPSLTGPDGDSFGAKIDGDSLTGWARFCSVYKDPSACSGEEKDPNGPELGGWDGWVKMVNITKDQTTGGLSGFAWGDLNVGWLSFGLHNDDGTPPTECPVPLIGSCCPAWQVCSGDGPTTSVVCRVDPASGPVGTTFRWSVNVSDITGLNGDTPTYVYEWFGDAVANPASSGEVSEVSYTEVGPKTGHVRVTDTNSTQVTSANCLTSAGGLPNVCVADQGTITDPNQVCCFDTTVPRNVGDVCEPPPESCTVSISEDDDYGITLYFSPATPTYSIGGVTYFRSQTNQKITLSNGCNSKDITTSDLPLEVGLVCSQAGATLNWGPCTGLSGGEYWVGVYSATKPNPPTCTNINLNVGASSVLTEACFTGSIIN